MTGRFAYSEARRSLRFSEIRLSSNFVLGGECTHPSFNEPGRSWDDADKDDASFKALLFQNEPGGINIHPQGNFVLFADGHVQAFRRNDPAYLTWNPSEIRSWESIEVP
jgi:prepilin-type processing-associated H-X9-DG protein